MMKRLCCERTKRLKRKSNARGKRSTLQQVSKMVLPLLFFFGLVFGAVFLFHETIALHWLCVYCGPVAYLSVISPLEVDQSTLFCVYAHTLTAQTCTPYNFSATLILKTIFIQRSGKESICHMHLLGMGKQQQQQVALFGRGNMSIAWKWMAEWGTLLAWSVCLSLSREDQSTVSLTFTWISLYKSINGTALAASAAPPMRLHSGIFDHISTITAAISACNFIAVQSIRCPMVQRVYVFGYSFLFFCVFFLSSSLSSSGTKQFPFMVIFTL